MKKLLLFLCFSPVFILSCKKNQQTACGTQACTDNFSSVGVKFADSNNNVVVVTNFKVLDLRTNKTLTNTFSVSADLVPGAWIIVDDSNLKELSTNGDNI